MYLQNTSDTFTCFCSIILKTERITEKSIVDKLSLKTDLTPVNLVNYGRVNKL